MGAEREANSLSKYDLCTSNPFPDLNVAFGEGVRRTGGATARIVRRYDGLDLILAKKSNPLHHLEQWYENEGRHLHIAKLQF